MHFALRRIVGVGSLALISGMLVLGGSAVPARAGTWSLFSCAYPNGTPVNATSGWSAHMVGSPGPYSGTGNSCGQIGGSFGAESSNEWPQNLYSGWQWVFDAPAGSSIVGGSMQVGFYTPKGQAYLEDPENIYGPDVIANCQYNLPCTTTQYPALPDNGATHLYVGAECALDPCEPAGLGVNASVAIYRSTIVMQNGSVPTGGSFEGGPSTTNTLSGAQDLKFTAADPGGPGVYSVSASVDGATVYSQVPSGNSSTCVNQGQVASGYSFLSATPCAPSLSVTIPINTSTLADGAHTLKVNVTDAASNVAEVFDKSFNTNNAPTVTSPPTVSGSAQVGSTLNATSAVFAPRTGLGPLGPLNGQWLRCSGVGTGCSAIPGASSATYTPTVADRSYTIEYENSVEDAYKHAAHATSAPTVAVSEPVSGGSCSGSSCQGASGGSGGSGVGGNGGNGANGASGSGITVNVGGSGSNQGSVLLGSGVKWRVSLSVSPRKVRRHTKVKLSGSVSTSPRPGTGKLIYLQARSVSGVWRGHGSRRHRVTVYGKWVTFQAFRAKSNGAFSST
ncbi:MAG: hypothetical protein ACRDK2_07135, partial [Solirubrobacteraceae bacterium]